jgi:hypothetical protein
MNCSSSGQPAAASSCLASVATSWVMALLTKYTNQRINPTVRCRVMERIRSYVPYSNYKFSSPKPRSIFLLMNFKTEGVTKML